MTYLVDIKAAMDEITNDSSAEMEFFADNKVHLRVAVTRPFDNAVQFTFFAGDDPRHRDIINFAYDEENVSAKVTDELRRRYGPNYLNVQRRVCVRTNSDITFDERVEEIAVILRDRYAKRLAATQVGDSFDFGAFMRAMQIVAIEVQKANEAAGEKAIHPIYKAMVQERPGKNLWSTIGQSFSSEELVQEIEQATDIGKAYVHALANQLVKLASERGPFTNEPLANFDFKMSPLRLVCEVYRSLEPKTVVWRTAQRHYVADELATLIDFRDEAATLFASNMLRLSMDLVACGL